MSTEKVQEGDVVIVIKEVADFGPGEELVVTSVCGDECVVIKLDGPLGFTLGVPTDRLCPVLSYRKSREHVAKLETMVLQQARRIDELGTAICQQIRESTKKTKKS